MKKLIIAATLAAATFVPSSFAGQCTTTYIVVFSLACCPGASHYRCCCKDCHGLYQYTNCGGVVRITPWCCSQ